MWRWGCIESLKPRFLRIENSHSASDTAPRKPALPDHVQHGPGGMQSFCHHPWAAFLQKGSRAVTPLKFPVTLSVGVCEIEPLTLTGPRPTSNPSEIV